MICSPSSIRASLVTIGLTLVVTAGCQSSPEQQIKEAFRSAYRENGRRVATMYARFMASPTKPVVGRDGFSGPADEASLRRFIGETSAEALAEMGIKSPDAPELFTSERDGQPFRIRYGVKGPLNSVYAILCESTGVNGRVKVFMTDGSSKEVTADEAEAYLTGKQDVAYTPGENL